MANKYLMLDLLIVSKIKLVKCFLNSFLVGLLWIDKGMLGPVQTSNFSCTEPNTYLGRPE